MDNITEIIRNQNRALLIAVEELLDNAKFEPMGSTTKAILEDTLKELARTFADIDNALTSNPNTKGAYLLGDIIGKGKMASYVLNSVLNRAYRNTDVKE